MMKFALQVFKLGPYFIIDFDLVYIFFNHYQDI